MNETQYNWEIRELHDPRDGGTKVHLIHLCPQARVMGTPRNAGWDPIKKEWSCAWCKELAPSTIEAAAKLAGADKDTSYFMVNVAFNLEKESQKELTSTEKLKCLEAIAETWAND